jgi:cellular nucleic acid-binding protein
MEQLYILQLEGGKYYVGKTSDVMKRFEQHKTGAGAAWTKKYKPTRMIECRALTSDHDENNVTKDYMKKYGINNVRGGSYTQVSLPDDVESVLQREFRGNADVCYKCNLAGHFADRCPITVRKEEPVAVWVPGKPWPRALKPVEEEWECEYCDRTFTTKYGCSVHERSCKPAAKPKAKKATGACYRCGRTSHYSPDCYATTHVDGYDLDD